MNDTKNLAIFLALGIGVYFFMVRKSSAKGLDMRNYGPGVSYPGNQAQQPRQPTNSDYVDLASKAFDLYSAWTAQSAATTPAYVPDFTAANVGPVQAYNPAAYEWANP